MSSVLIKKQTHDYLIIMRETLMPISPTPLPIVLHSHTQNMQIKFIGKICNQKRKHNYVSLIVFPANVVMFNCQGAMYNAKIWGNSLISQRGKYREMQ